MVPVGGGFSDRSFGGGHHHTYQSSPTRKTSEDSPLPLHLNPHCSVHSLDISCEGPSMQAQQMYGAVLSTSSSRDGYSTNCSDFDYSGIPSASAFIPIVPLTETYTRPRALSLAPSVLISHVECVPTSAIDNSESVGPPKITEVDSVCRATQSRCDEEVTCSAVAVRVLGLLRRELMMQLDASWRLHREGQKPQTDFEDYRRQGQTVPPDPESTRERSSVQSPPMLSMTCCCGNTEDRAESGCVEKQQRICSEHLHVSLAPDTEDILVQGTQAMSSFLTSVQIIKNKSVTISVPGHTIATHFSADGRVRSAHISLNVTSLAIALLQAIDGR